MSSGPGLTFGARLGLALAVALAVVAVVAGMATADPGRAVLALAGGAAAFYLAGGRTLTRAHRHALASQGADALALARTDADGFTLLDDRGDHGAEIPDSVSMTTPASKVDALRALLDDGGVDMAFQPIWDLEGGSLLGVEALARPARRHGFSGPSETFDVAERAGWVHELDMLCVKRALSRAVELPPEALLFINVAPRTLHLDADGDDWLVAAVQGSGIAPGRVVVEVTERFGARMSSVVKSLERLRAAGLKLALDDVGAGNSGLEMLSRLNVEFVKIDRGVVNGALTDTRARAVLMAMATFAVETGASVIAEGIEDGDMLRFLHGLPEDPTAARPRVHAGQGYGLGRPASALPAAGRGLSLAAA